MMSYASSLVFGGEENVTKDQEDTASESENEEIMDVRGLQELFPALSEEELTRFKTAFVLDDDGNEDDCINKLEDLAKFRAIYELNDPSGFPKDETDAAVWKWASQKAIEAAKTQPELIPGLEGCVPMEERVCELEEIPQNCHCYTNEDGSPVLTKDGAAVVHYMSAILDLDAMSKEIHVLALSLYLDRKCPSICSTGQPVFLMVDARQGAGWKNHNVLKVVGFLRMLSDSLHKLQAGRLGKMMIYPVPYACVYVFTMLKSYLPAAIAENIVLINGSDGPEDPAPTEELSEYVERSILDKCETQRRSQYHAEE